MSALRCSLGSPEHTADCGKAGGRERRSMARSWLPCGLLPAAAHLQQAKAVTQAERSLRLRKQAHQACAGIVRGQRTRHARGCELACTRHAAPPARSSKETCMRNEARRRMQQHAAALVRKRTSERQQTLQPCHGVVVAACQQQQRLQRAPVQRLLLRLGVVLHRRGQHLRRGGAHWRVRAAQQRQQRRQPANLGQVARAVDVLHMVLQLACSARGKRAARTAKRAARLRAGGRRKQKVLPRSSKARVAGRAWRAARAGACACSFATHPAQQPGAQCPQASARRLRRRRRRAPRSASSCVQPGRWCWPAPRRARGDVKHSCGACQRVVRACHSERQSGAASGAWPQAAAASVA
jgi:hypothetical protein